MLLGRGQGVEPKNECPQRLRIAPGIPSSMVRICPADASGTSMPTVLLARLLGLSLIGVALQSPSSM